MRTDVAILGGGLAGLTLALQLRQRLIDDDVLVGVLLLQLIDVLKDHGASLDCQPAANQRIAIVK